MTITVKKFNLAPRETIIFALLALVGIVSFIIGLQLDPQRAWTNYLVGYYFWLCISLAGVFFSGLQFLTGSMWSAPIRRVAEVFIAFLPVAAVLFIVLYFGRHYLFEWTHAEVVANDAILKGKSAYLNDTFFWIRAVILFAIMFLFGGKIIKNSIKQDETGDVELTKKNVTLSAPFIFLFAWGFTFAVAFDLMMSLSPHWFSTMFGVYCWAGLFTSGLAMMTIWIVTLRKQGILDAFVSDNHLHDLGKLMFAFTVFWGYVGFSQFMLIWYSNLPEENFFFINRMTPEWEPISIALMIIKFGIPFFVLMGRPLKRNANFLYVISIWFLVAQYLDVYWMVFPTFYKAPIFGWMEVGIFVGFMGLFLLSVGRFLSKVNPIAIKDPYLEESFHHHQ